VSRLGACHGHGPVFRTDRPQNNGRRRVRSEGQLGAKSSKRVQTGEPVCNPRLSRHLIDFIAGISGVSSGLAPLDSDPGVDSNHSALAHDGCQFWVADNPGAIRRGGCFSGGTPYSVIGRERGQSRRPLPGSQCRSDGDDLRTQSGARVCWGGPDHAERHRSRLHRQTRQNF